METFWLIYYVSVILFGIFIYIKLTFIYSSYIKLKLKEDPEFNVEKYQYNSEFFVVKTCYIKENDMSPALIKIKEKYNGWIKAWWVLMIGTVVFTFLIYFIGLLF